MMTVKRFSVQKLNKLSRKYTIWCMGCGKRLNEMLDSYQDEAFVSKIEKLVDNNSKLWGIEKKVGLKNIKISGKESIAKMNNQKVLLLITSDRYNEIYKSIEDYVKDDSVICALYPTYYYSYAKQIMRVCARLLLRTQLLFYAGSEPHENADAVTDYLNTEYQKKKYRIIYVTNKEEEKAGVVYINKNALERRTHFKEVIRYCYYYATSKYLFYENEPLQKVRKNQKLIYLNHGTVPLKQVSDVLKQPATLDYAICPSAGCADIYQKQYGVPREKQIYIMPARVNNLLSPRFTNEWEKKYILWLPTFRQLSGSDRKDSKSINPIEIVSSEAVWQALDECLKQSEYYLIIKKHPREKTDISIPEKCQNIQVLTEEVIEKQGTSLQEILGKADALITDYSGIAFEYMLLDRPIGYVISDMEEYTRGFSVENPLDYMPGPKIKSFEQLVQFCQEVFRKHDEYEEQRKLIVQKLFRENAYENGAKKLIDYIDAGRI